MNTLASVSLPDVLDFARSQSFDLQRSLSLAEAVATHHPDLVGSSYVLALPGSSISPCDMLSSLFASPKPVQRILGLNLNNGFSKAFGALLVPSVPPALLATALGDLLALPASSFSTDQIDVFLGRIHAELFLALLIHFSISSSPLDVHMWSLNGLYFDRSYHVCSAPTPSASSSIPPSVPPTVTAPSGLDPVELTKLLATVLAPQAAAIDAKFGAMSSTLSSVVTLVDRLSGSVSTLLASKDKSAHKEPASEEPSGNSLLYRDGESTEERVSLSDDLSVSVGSGSNTSNLHPDVLSHPIALAQADVHFLPNNLYGALPSGYFADATKGDGLIFALVSRNLALISINSSKYSVEGLTVKILGNKNPRLIPSTLFPTCIEEFRAHVDQSLDILLLMPDSKWTSTMRSHYRNFTSRIFQRWTALHSAHKHVTQFASLLQMYLTFMVVATFKDDPSILSSFDSLWESHYCFLFNATPSLEDLPNAFTFLGYKCSSCKNLSSHKLCCGTTSCQNQLVKTAPQQDSGLYNAFVAWKLTPEAVPHLSKRNLFGWYKSSSFSDKSLVAAHNSKQVKTSKYPSFNA